MDKVNEWKKSARQELPQGSMDGKLPSDLELRMLKDHHRPRLPLRPELDSPRIQTLTARSHALARQSSVMPIPESEYFKSRKPKVPPTFDGVDYDDNQALHAARDAIIREQWVKNMMARLVREELSKCYYREGVNHLENCGHLRGS